MKLWFFSKTKFFVILSCVIILAGLIAGIINGGLNLGIDFTGGTIFTVEMGTSFSDADINAALTANGINPSSTQIVHATNTAAGNETGNETGNEAVIRMQTLPSGKSEADIRQAIVTSLQQKYQKASPGSIEHVGGVTSKEIIMNAFWAIVMASGLILIYVWIRFTLYSGIGGVVALIHDLLVMTAFVAITRIEINSSYIAACLTILGYSINDTIVVFDRIRENNKRYNLKEMNRWEIADISIRETLPRTINTSLTVVITTLAVYVFGVQSIKDFTLPLLVGIVSGTYSSIFIASPIWVAFENRRDKKLKFKALPQKAKA